MITAAAAAAILLETGGGTRMRRKDRFNPHSSSSIAAQPKRAVVQQGKDAEFFRTSKHIAKVKRDEQRRIRNNERAKHRSDEIKKELRRIMNKPSGERTGIENKFLEDCFSRTAAREKESRLRLTRGREMPSVAPLQMKNPQEQHQMLKMGSLPNHEPFQFKSTRWQQLPQPTQEGASTYDQSYPLASPLLAHDHQQRSNNLIPEAPLLPITLPYAGATSIFVPHPRAAPLPSFCYGENAIHQQLILSRTPALPMLAGGNKMARHFSPSLLLDPPLPSRTVRDSAAAARLGGLSATALAYHRAAHHDEQSTRSLLLPPYFYH